MPVTYKKQKLTNKQKIIQKTLDELSENIRKLYYDSCSFVHHPEFGEIQEAINNAKSSYGLETNYLTLGEYLKTNAGVRRRFIFKIMGMSTEVSSVEEFGETFNRGILSQYIVKRARRCNFYTWLDEKYIYIKLYLEKRKH